MKTLGVTISCLVLKKKKSRRGELSTSSSWRANTVSAACPSMAATYMQSIHSSFINTVSQVNNVKPDLLEKLQSLSYGLGADKRAHTVEAERRQLFL